MSSTCLQCGALMLTPTASCWLCAAPIPPHPTRIAMHRFRGWWSMTAEELRAIELAHVGINRALMGARPNDALMATCYAALKKHGIAPLPPAK